MLRAIAAVLGWGLSAALLWQVGREIGWATALVCGLVLLRLWALESLWRREREERRPEGWRAMPLAPRPDRAGVPIVLAFEDGTAAVGRYYAPIRGWVSLDGTVFYPRPVGWRPLLTTGARVTQEGR